MQIKTFIKDSGLKIRSTERVGYFDMILIANKMIKINTHLKEKTFLITKYILENLKTIKLMVWDRCSFIIMISSKATGVQD